MLKPGRSFAVVSEYEEKREILTDRAYFTIPAIEQWWMPHPTQAPAPTPTEDPTLDVTAKPTSGKTAVPIHTASPLKAASGIGTIHIVAYVILGVIICAEFAVICYLAKKKK